MDKTHFKIRYVVLIAFLIMFSGFSLLHQLSERSNPSVDALCPFGGVETFYTFITTGGFVPRILMSSFVLAVGVLLTVLIFRRGFCGYICPFGTIQELLGLIFKKKITVPEKLDSVLRYLKYLILAAILFGTAYTSILIFRSYDPFITFFHFGKGIIWGEYESALLIGFIITILTLLISLFIERAWCKYFCPLGATMAIFSKLGITKINRDPKKCIDCKVCDKACPVNVHVSTVDHVKSAECINCNICVAKCPTKALSNKAFKKELSLNIYLLLLLFLFFSVILTSMALQVWDSTPDVKLSDTEGTLLPANIKGWMTLDEVSRETKIPLIELYAGLNLTQEVDPKTPLKDISSKYDIAGFETDAVRIFIQNRK